MGRRTFFLVDGFNFYHSIRDMEKRLRWFDFTAFCRHFLREEDELAGVTWFTALPHWRREESLRRHRVFMEACRIMGVKIVAGRFKRKQRRCAKCGLTSEMHEEKATDVNIALHAYRLARQAESVFIVSGDTDFLPAILAVKEDFPHVHVGVIFPMERFSKELASVADTYHRVKRDVLMKFILPMTLERPQGGSVWCPPEWS